ncbi:MAG: type IV pilin protein [Burkholderiaceae bacterium]
MSLKSRAVRAGNAGFTLIELMVAVAVMAILTAIALPNYSEYMLRSARADARATMMEASQFMQRFYAMNNAYDRTRTGAAVALPPALTQSPRDGAARYMIQVVGLTPDSYSIRATPVGASATDRCGWLALQSTGRRKSQNLTVDECWR